MDSSPKVSVIMPIFNAEPFLAECLQSLRSQTAEDFEIVAVNDGSTDASREILGEFAARDERIRIVDQANGGLAAARNSGFAFASGEYVLYLDADDSFEPTMIEEAYARCKEHDADVCVFNFRLFGTDTSAPMEVDWSLHTELVPGRLPFAPDEMHGHLFRFVTPVVWNKMIRRSFLMSAGLAFDPGFKRAEDVPFTYMVLALAERITVLDRVLVNYRTNNESSQLATIHTAPLDILRALLRVKHDATAAQAFAPIERDFVNAALEQCLYNLDALGTTESAQALFERLKCSGFAELGVIEHDADHYFDARKYEQYRRVIEQDWIDYLFGETRLLREDLTKAGEWARELSRSLDGCRADLASEAGNCARVQEALVAEAGNYARVQEALETEARNYARLEEELDAVQTKLLAEILALREQVRSTRASLAAAKEAQREASSKLKQLQESRSYRLARFLTAVPREVKRILARSKNAG